MKIPLNNLSPHLFWDVDMNNLDFEKSKKLIIQRVLDYGLIDDWQIIFKTYGIGEIAKTAVSLRDLDIKSASFISVLSKIPLEQFLCYTSKRSSPELNQAESLSGEKFIKRGPDFFHTL